MHTLKRGPGRPKKTVPPPPAPPTPAERIKLLEGFVNDHRIDAKLRLEAKIELRGLQPEPPKPEPKPAPIGRPQDKWTPPTPAQEQERKSWELRNAVKSRNYTSIELITKAWLKNWPDVPVPYYEPPPLPERTTPDPTPTQRRMEQCVRTAKQEQLDFEAKLKARQTMEARGAALQAKRTPILGAAREFDDTWVIDYQ